MLADEVTAQVGVHTPTLFTNHMVLQFRADVFVVDSRVLKCSFPAPVGLGRVNGCHQLRMAAFDGRDIQRLIAAVEALDLGDDLALLLCEISFSRRHGFGGSIGFYCRTCSRRTIAFIGHIP